MTRAWIRYVHPFNVDLIWRFKELSRNLPLWKSLTWLLDQINVEVRITSGKYLSKGPQLIIGNHHSPLDGVTTLSTIEREDHRFIGARGYRILGEKVREKHFPVYVSRKQDRNPIEIIRKQVVSRFTEGLTREEALKKNWQAVNRGCEHVSAGGSLLIAPAGGRFFGHSQWQSGLGHIINGIENPDTQIVLARNGGSSHWNLVRYLNPYIFGPFLKRLYFSMDISQPMRLMDFQDRDKPAAEVSLDVQACAGKIFEWF